MAIPGWKQLVPTQQNESDRDLLERRTAIIDLLKAKEAALAAFQQQAQHPAGPDGQHSGMAAGSQPQPARSRSASKRGAMGFTPLARPGPTPSSTPRPAQQAQRHGAQLLLQGHSPDAAAAHGSTPDSSFRTPAAARLPAPGQGLQAPVHWLPGSEVPTNLAAGSALQRCLGARSPQPRQWGMLPLQQQQAGGAAQQGRGDAAQAAGPAQDAAAGRPRGFQGGLQNRRPRGNATTQQAAAAARKSSGPGWPRNGAGSLNACPSNPQAAAAPAPQAAIEPDLHEEPAPSRGDDPVEATGTSPKRKPAHADEERASQEGQQDEIECPPSAAKGGGLAPGGSELPAWRSKRRGGDVQQRARGQERGQARLSLSLRAARRSASPEAPPGIPPARTSVPGAAQTGLPGSPGLFDRRGAGAAEEEAAEAQLGSPDGTLERQQSEEQTSERESLKPASFAPETCMSAVAFAAAFDSVPDTPDAKGGPAPNDRASQGADGQQQRQPWRALNGELVGGTSAPEHDAAGEQERSVQHADSSEAVPAPSTSAAADACAPQGGTEGQCMRFGRSVLAAVPSPCGGFVAVCLAEEAGAACSMQVWQLGAAAGGAAPCWAGTACVVPWAGRPEGVQLQRSFCLSAARESGALLAMSGLLEEPGPAPRQPCVSLVRFSVRERGRQQRSAELQLPTPTRTYCVLTADAGLLFAAGEGGGVQRWTMHDGGDLRAPETLPALPAACFGGIEFPNVAELAPAGPDRLLGCSSAGSVALWDHARGELLIARQDPGYAFASLHALPDLAPVLSAAPAPVAAVAARMRPRGRPDLDAARQAPPGWRPGHALLLRRSISARPFPIEQEVTHMSMAGTLAALAMSDGSVHVIDIKQGRALRTLPSRSAGVASLALCCAHHLLLASGDSMHHYDLHEVAD